MMPKLYDLIYKDGMVAFDIYTNFTRDGNPVFIANNTYIPYRIMIKTINVNLAVKWCEENCQELWGFYAIDYQTYLGFSNPNELTLFSLSNDY